VKPLQVVFYGDPNGYPPIINLARLLSESGWSVEILCRHERTHADVPWPVETNIVRCGPRSGHRWGEYLGFVREAGRHARSDAIVAGHDMHGLLPAWLMARASGAPLVYQCHDFTESSRRLPAGSRVVKLLEPVLARSARLVVAPDAGRARAIRAALGLAEDPLIVPNAPRLDARGASGRLREALAARSAKLDRIVLRQGRIGPGHGIEATLHSMPRWSSPTWGFVVMGPADPAYVDRLRESARKLGVAERFVVLPPVAYDEVAGFTREADVGHALYEPININHVEAATASNKVIEYMAAGIAAIVPDFPSFRELVARTGGGMPVDGTKPDAIAAAVNALLGDPALAGRLGAAGRRAFEAELHYDLHAARLRDRLEALAATL
jgi:glycosyltransferase involved in cell wall biosynthesis